MKKEYVKNLNPEVKIVKVSVETVSEAKDKPEYTKKIKGQTDTWSRAIKVRY